MRRNRLTRTSAALLEAATLPEAGAAAGPPLGAVISFGPLGAVR
jgi:hypothetical protein